MATIRNTIPPYFVTLITLLFISAKASSQSASELFRHPKLIEINEGPPGKGASGIIENAYIIRLSGAVKSVRSAVSRLMISSTQDGGTVDFVYKHVFKGFSVSNVSNLGMTEILDSPIVHSAERSSKCSASKVQRKAIWSLDMLTAKYRDERYKYTYDGTGVIAYVMDSGIDYKHKEFEGRATCGWDGYDTDCFDDDGHGTHVAGTIGSKTYGAAKQVSLIGVKVLTKDGGSVLESVSGLWSVFIAGIDWVIGQKRINRRVPMIINISIQGGKTALVNRAVNSATKCGIIVVTAAGNDYGVDSCKISPASATSAITVGATNYYNNTVSFFSNGGKKCIDIMAPGEEIYSVTSCDAFPKNCTIPSILDGTSMASPLVAGVAALHLQKNGTLTQAQVRRAILDDARRGVVNDFGYIVPNILLSAKSILL